MIRLIAVFAAMAFSAAAQAQVLEVFIWKALPGVSNANPQLFANGLRAKAIQGKHGAQVSVARDQMNNMHFSLMHENYAAMNEFYKNLNQDEANAEFWRDGNANPIAELTESYLLDVVAEGKGGPVYEVFIWQPLPGKVGAMIQGAMGAKPLHDKIGLGSVSILMDRLNRLHYLIQFESWEQHAKFWDTPNPAFNEYMEKLNQDPSAELVKNYSGSEVQQ